MITKEDIALLAAIAFNRALGGTELSDRQSVKVDQLIAKLRQRGDLQSACSESF